MQQVFEMTLFRGLKRVKVISHARQMIRVSVVSNSANLQLIECFGHILPVRKAVDR